MKQFLTIISLLLIVTVKGQVSVGIVSGYTNRIGDEAVFNYYIHTGLYTNIPIWRQLSVNTGCNFLTTKEHIAFFYEPWYAGAPIGTKTGINRKNVLEVPVELVLGLTKDAEANPKVYTHLGYALGTNISSRNYYYDNQDKLIGTKRIKENKTLYNNISFELECRWLILKKYTASLFVLARFIGDYWYYDGSKSRYHWGNHVGTGLRLGMVLPKKKQ